jgi:hypothetical protein
LLIKREEDQNLTAPYPENIVHRLAEEIIPALQAEKKEEIDGGIELYSN